MFCEPRFVRGSNVPVIGVSPRLKYEMRPSSKIVVVVSTGYRIHAIVWKAASDKGCNLLVILVRSLDVVFVSYFVNVR